MKANAHSPLIISLLVGLSIISNSASAQSGVFFLHDLSGKTWDMQCLTGKTSSDKYDSTEVTHYFNGKLIGTSEYYLSDSIVSVFDPSKIGSVSHGKYIIRRAKRDLTENNSPRPTSVFEIIELDTTSLIMRYIEHQHLLIFKAIN
jgi:hypothetical protein